MSNNENPVAIITGASSGIGSAVARLAASQGYRVLINYNSSRAGAESVLADCEALGAEALIHQADVGNDADCKAMAAAAGERWGRIDVLVNNAGTTKFCPHGDLDGLDASDFQNLYQVNAIGAFQMIRAVVPTMKQTGGTVVNVASVAGLWAVGSSLAYACSKAAMLAINRSMARELGPEIRVNAVCPGMVEGEWLREGLGEELYPMVEQHFQTQSSTGAIMTAETVAESIWYFAAGAPNVTGEHLVLDGGASLPY